MGIVLENQQRAHRQQLCNHLKNATRGFTSLILQYETNRKEPAVNMAASYTHSAATNKAVLDRYMRLPQPDDKIMATYVWIDGTGEYCRANCQCGTMMEAQLTKRKAAILTFSCTR